MNPTITQPPSQPTLKQAFDDAMAQAMRHLRQNELDHAEAHLARAHVLGQYQVWPHVRTHIWLLVVEWRRRRVRAMAGQIVRIVLGAVGSAVNIVPVGNPGTSDVSMFSKGVVPPALRELIGKR